MSRIKKNLASKRRRSLIKNKFSELRFCRSVCEETKELFFEYDQELNLILGDLSRINKPVSAASPEASEKSLVKSSNSDKKIMDEKQNSTQQAEHQENESGPEEKEEEIAEPPAWMKKLFKKIALETHPDKISSREDLLEYQKKEREILYKKAVDSIENVDEMAIIEIAILLEIDPGVAEKKQLEILSTEIEKVMHEIESYRNLVAWTWGENIGDVETRLKLLKYIMGILKMPAVEDTIISEYLNCFEAGEDVEVFIKKIGGRKRRQKISDRKVGHRPSPSVAQLRKEKSGT